MEATNNNYRNDIVFLLMAVAVTILLGLLTSCRTKYVSVPQVSKEYITKTDTVQLIRTDSILLHDSVWVSQYVQGDTVYLAKEVYKTGIRWRDRYVYKTHTDTLIRTDTIGVPYPVEATLTKSQQRYINIGKYACGVGIGVVIILLASAIWWYRRKV